MQHFSYLLILQCIVYTTLQSAGFIGDTLILTDQRQTQIREIELQETILAQSNTAQTVTHISAKTIPSALCIEVADDIIICHPDQLFWSINANRFVPASKLAIGNLLLTFDNQQLVIANISSIHQETLVYSITVTNPHHLFVGKSMVLAHNWGGVVVAGVTVCFGAGIEIIGTISAGIAFCGALIGLTWGKKNDEPVFCRPTFGNGNDNTPLFNYYTPTYRHGIYEDSPKHGTKQRGNISPRPTNGQKALDNSIDVSGSTQRVSVSDGEIVILKETSPRKYHGYTVTWKGLEQGGKKYEEIRKILKNNNLVTRAGKIIN